MKVCFPEFYLVVIFLVGLPAVVFMVEIQLPIETFSGDIAPDSSTTYIEAIGQTTGNYSVVSIHYQLLVRNYIASPVITENLNPVLYLRHSGQAGYSTPNGCLGGLDYYYYKIYDPRLVSLNPFFRRPGKDKECVVDEMHSDFLRCEGSVDIAVGIDVQWYVTVAYECGIETRPFNLQYNFTVTPYVSVECYDMASALREIDTLTPEIGAFVNFCASLYPMYSKFNIIGFSEWDVSNTGQVYLRSNDRNCYAHTSAYSCLSAFPPCIHGQIQLPCAEMCYDLVRGCSTVNVTSNINCNSLNPEIEPTCAYNPVECTEVPMIPKNAKVVFENGSLASSIKTLECKPEHEPKGSPTISCGYDGIWKTDFECESSPPYKSNKMLILALSLSAAVLSIIIIVLLSLGILYKPELKLLSYHYLGIRCCPRKRKEKDKNYHVFIAFETETNYNYVKNELHPRLWQSHYELCTSYKDFLPGENLMELIPMAISRSFGVLLMLNQAFLDSKYCRYELLCSFLQKLDEDDFQILIITEGDPRTLRNIPWYLKPYLKTNLYLAKSDPRLIDKLKRSLPSSDTVVRTNALLTVNISSESNEAGEESSFELDVSYAP